MPIIAARASCQKRKSTVIPSKITTSSTKRRVEKGGSTTSCVYANWLILIVFVAIGQIVFVSNLDSMPKNNEIGTDPVAYYNVNKKGFSIHNDSTKFYSNRASNATAVAEATANSSAAATGAAAAAAVATAATTKPKLYLHVGPMKTGSTYLQNMLARHHTELEKDNHYYVGKVNREHHDLVPNEEDIVRPLVTGDMFWKWFLGPEAEKSRKVSETRDRFFRELRDRHANHNHSVVASAEEFSQLKDPGLPYTMFETLHDLLDPFFDVHVIMVYRRYMDWAVSMYRYDNTRQWFNRAEWNRWPQKNNNERARSASTFRDYMVQKEEVQAEHQLNFYYAFSNPPPPPHSNNSGGSSSLWNIHVVPMHRLTNLGVELFCNVLTDATHACHSVTTGKNHRNNKQDDGGDDTKKVNENSDRFGCDYELMTIRAHQLGWVHPEKTSRKNVVVAFNQAFNKWKIGRIPVPINSRKNHPDSDNDNNDNRDNITGIIPLDCLTREEEELLLQRSIDTESTLLGARTHPEDHNTDRANTIGNRTDHSNNTAAYESKRTITSVTEDFQGMVKQHDFCNVHLDALFRDAFWKRFLSCLRSSPHEVQRCVP